MKFSNKLINWYDNNKRDLPWRETKDPYLIWLSEVILQQTRVNQGLDYYYSFSNKYPNVESLAEASEEDVLNTWQGLGYYSRARNLHYTAKYITKEYQGKFPTDYKNIIALKGVGKYTAAAIASFSYNQCYPVIDGNVYRVLSRVFGVKEEIDSNNEKKVFEKLANELIERNSPAIYNQAIMEFGAICCSPKNPNCEECPFRLECYAYQHNEISTLPQKGKKTKQRDRYFNYIVVLDNQNTCLRKRTDNDIWKGLFDFPLLETKKNIENFDELTEELSNYRLYSKKAVLISKSDTFKHILSHQRIHATFWKIEGDIKKDLPSQFNILPIEKIDEYPVPRLIENYINTTF